MAVDGTYNIEMELPTGKEPSTVTLKTEGDVLSGVSVDKDGSETAFDGGTADDNSFSVTLESSGPAGPMQITVSGILEGDDISGTFVGSGFQIPFSGNRA